MAAVEQLQIVKKILVEATNALCSSLDPDDVLWTLQTKGALKPDDVTKIRCMTTPGKQVEKLLGILMRKPVSAYEVFMEALKEERADLFNVVKEIATKHGYKPSKFLSAIYMIVHSACEQRIHFPV